MVCSVRCSNEGVCCHVVVLLCCCGAVLLMCYLGLIFDIFGLGLSLVRYFFFRFRDFCNNWSLGVQGSG